MTKKGAEEKEIEGRVEGRTEAGTEKGNNFQFLISS
jgi:hypothetical protein